MHVHSDFKQWAELSFNYYSEKTNIFNETLAVNNYNSLLEATA